MTPRRSRSRKGRGCLPRFRRMPPSPPPRLPSPRRIPASRPRGRRPPSCFTTRRRTACTTRRTGSASPMSRTSTKPLRMNYMVNAQTGKALARVQHPGRVLRARHRRGPGRQRRHRQQAARQHRLVALQRQGGPRHEEERGRHLQPRGRHARQGRGDDGRANKDPRPPARPQFKDNNNVWGESRRRRAQQGRGGRALRRGDDVRLVQERPRPRLASTARARRSSPTSTSSNNYVNAFWDGEQMNYGDGDGKDVRPAHHAGHRRPRDHPRPHRAHRGPHLQRRVRRPERGHERHHGHRRGVVRRARRTRR